MYCPKCSASVADDANFCPRCGTPFQKRNGFVATLWRDNKPGFLILSLLLIAMLASIGYYLSSRTGRFVVTVEGVSENEVLDILAKATLKEFCQQFPGDCDGQPEAQLTTSIKRILPDLVNPLKSGQRFARVLYKNDTSDAIEVTQFKYRRPPGPWTTDNSPTIYKPKAQTLRVAIQMGGNKASFRDKVDLALTTAAITNHGSFILPPGEEKLWRLSNVNTEAEFQVEYRQNGKLLGTSILRMR